MRVTVDTNVLISATFWNGSSNKIIEKVENKELELILSYEIIEEFVRVLNYEGIQQKIRDKNLEMNRTVEKIVEMSKVIESKVKLNIIKEDPDDNKILECAKAGQVDFIVSNDNHLLKLKSLEGINIVSAEEFIKKL